jgi:predicted transcriptional regulator
MPVSENRRTDSVRVRLSDDMMARLERVSLGYGMPVSTVAAFAISDFVQQKENTLAMGRDAINKMADQALESLDLDLNPEAAKALAAAFEPLILAMQKPGTAKISQPIDHEEAHKAS